MLYTILAVFALAAIMGLILISYVLRTRETPKGIVVLHGLFAATGLGLLIFYVYGNQAGPMEALILFIIAAVAGFTMLARDLGRKSIPGWLAIVHGLVAVSGFILLLIFAMRG